MYIYNYYISISYHIQITYILHGAPASLFTISWASAGINAGKMVRFTPKGLSWTKFWIPQGRTVGIFDLHANHKNSTKCRSNTQVPWVLWDRWDGWNRLVFLKNNDEPEFQLKTYGLSKLCGLLVRHGAASLNFLSFAIDAGMIRGKYREKVANPDTTCAGVRWRLKKDSVAENFQFNVPTCSNHKDLKDL